MVYRWRIHRPCVTFEVSTSRPPMRAIVRRRLSTCISIGRRLPKTSSWYLVPILFEWWWDAPLMRYASRPRRTRWVRACNEQIANKDLRCQDPTAASRQSTAGCGNNCNDRAESGSWTGIDFAMKLSSLRNRAVLRHTAVTVAAALAIAGLGGVATAEPGAASSISSIIEDGRTWQLQVYSASMDKDVIVQVQRPVDESKPAPSLYLLSGLDAGEGSASWQQQTDALTFLSDKQVNVVLPIGGRGSYYADWRQEDPVLGVNKWQTFLTEELPPLLDAALGSTGLNSLAGLSTSGTAVLQMAETKPGLFRSVAAYSGCAQIADPVGRQFVKLAVETWTGGNTVNMYGPDNDPAWAENDPVINAEKLRGTDLYISSGSGVPQFEDVRYYTEGNGPQGVVNLGLGVVIEGATNYCSHNLKDRLDSLGIPATYQFPPVGTHYWPYWQEALHDSWPVLARGMGI